MGKKFHGVENSQEIASGGLYRNVKDLPTRFFDWIESPNGSVAITMGVSIAFFMVPALSFLSLLIMLLILRFALTRQFRLPFRMPQTSGMLDYGDPKPGADAKPGEAKGIAFLGNELNTRKELWFKDDDMRTHLLIFGSTGAGKTESLISIAFNALVHASGFIYVDGKGDSSLFAKIFSMTRFMGREDDLLVINYMTGSRDVFGPQASKLSNTLNPFTTGSSGGLTELLVSLMDESGGDGAMWKGRAISLISAIMMALVDKRDKKQILLDVDVIRDYMILENIIKLSKERDLPPHVITSIRSYLRSLPGYQENAPKQSETVMDQHGYLQMQFTRILGSLADSYGYIFRTNLGEVDFWDVVANRRILVVLLPALEKSPEELANLGKIVVACLKQMMSIGLGSMLEGEYKKIIETKPTYSKTPFLCILDEYGYYAVKGAAVMPAQARSLGFSMIFAGQDYPAFEKASKEEAASTVANCNIKIFMKLEDPKDTYDLFHKLVGQAYVTHVSGFQANTGGLVTSYNDMQNANVEKRDRGDLRDLKEQREGEAHIIFKSSVIRAQMFYAAPKMSSKLQLNSFLRVEAPEKSEVLELDSSIEDLLRRLTQDDFMEDLEADILSDIEIIKKIKDEYPNMETGERMCVGLVKYSQVLSMQMGNFKSKTLQFEEDDDVEASMNIFSNSNRESISEVNNKPKNRMMDDEDDINFDATENEDEYPSFLNEEKTRTQMKNLERNSGGDEGDVDLLIDDMKLVTKYPHYDPPEEKESDDIMEMLQELDNKITELENDSE